LHKLAHAEKWAFYSIGWTEMTIKTVPKIREGGRTVGSGRVATIIE